MEQPSELIPANGGTGGELQTSGRNRGALSLLQRGVETGHEISETALPKILAFANKVIDDPASTDRDRMRATELLTTLLMKGYDVAMSLQRTAPEQPVKATKTTTEYVIEFDRGG